MKKFLSFAVIFLALMGNAWAEDAKAPVPAPPGDGDVLPPPLDMNQMTPLPMPPAGEASSPADSTKATDTNTNTAIPAPPPALPAATPEKAADVSAPPAAEKAAAPVETKKEAVPTLGPFADYFPTAQGSKWTYEYLKAAAGSKTKKTRTVECTAQEAGVDGSVSATFQVTEDGNPTIEKYSLSANQVTRVSNGEYAYQFPVNGKTAKWVSGGKNFKASMGKAVVYKKTYSDCVVVTGKSAGSMVISYYAKGIGLVAIEVYAKGMKLDQTKSIALVSGPAGDK